MIILLLFLELSLAIAAMALFLYASAKHKSEFMDWLVLVLVFFAIIKLASIFMVFYASTNIADVSATLDLGFATAFTAFVFLRCREIGIV